MMNMNTFNFILNFTFTNSQVNKLIYARTMYTSKEQVLFFEKHIVSLTFQGDKYCLY